MNRIQEIEKLLHGLEYDDTMRPSLRVQVRLQLLAELGRAREEAEYVAAWSDDDRQIEAIEDAEYERQWAVDLTGWAMWLVMAIVAMVIG